MKRMSFFILAICLTLFSYVGCASFPNEKKSTNDEIFLRFSSEANFYQDKKEEFHQDKKVLKNHDKESPIFKHCIQGAVTTILVEVALNALEK